MLVCSVVLRPKRGTIAATINETAFAFDAPTPGAIFAILADDPGAAIDVLDAFVGQIMTEAASAADAVDAGSIRNAIIVEETNAGASPNAIVLDVSGGIAAPMAEVTTADNVQDATITGAFAVAAIDGVFIRSMATSTVLGTEDIESGPIAPFD